MKRLIAVAVLLFTVAGLSRADVVAISSSTATRISRGDGARKHLIVQNASTNPVYLSFTTSSATVSAGYLLLSSATTVGGAARVDILDYPGNVYGLAAPGAAGEVRTLAVPR
jgi:hypothetical protein